MNFKLNWYHFTSNFLHQFVLVVDQFWKCMCMCKYRLWFKRLCSLQIRYFIKRIHFYFRNHKTNKQKNYCITDILFPSGIFQTPHQLFLLFDPLLLKKIFPVLLFECWLLINCWLIDCWLIVVNLFYLFIFFFDQKLLFNCFILVTTLFNVSQDFLGDKKIDQFLTTEL